MTFLPPYWTAVAVAFLAGMVLLHWIDTGILVAHRRNIHDLAKQAETLRSQIVGLEGELDRETDYGKRLLDDPEFYADQRRVLDLVCSPHEQLVYVERY